VIYDNRKEKLDPHSEDHEEGQRGRRTSQERRWIGAKEHD